MEIKIRGLEITACHGVLPEEKVNPQRFIFDIDLDGDFLYGALNDDLGETVDYGEVCLLVEEITKNNSFDLIEKLSAECAFSILESFEKVQKVRVTCNKPEAPIELKFSTVCVTAEFERAEVYLSLGSSMGDREGYLKTAIKLLEKTRGIEVKKISEFMETEPYGGVAKNKFLNCAVCVNTFLPPHALLDEIHRIESECGRVRNKHWEDRTLDIDIIFYGDKTISDETLTIPHPDYKNRDFVIKPLKSIAPHKF